LELVLKDDKGGEDVVFTGVIKAVSCFIKQGVSLKIHDQITGKMGVVFLQHSTWVQLDSVDSLKATFYRFFPRSVVVSVTYQPPPRPISLDQSDAAANDRDGGITAVAHENLGSLATVAVSAVPGERMFAVVKAPAVNPKSFTQEQVIRQAKLDAIVALVEGEHDTVEHDEKLCSSDVEENGYNYVL